MSRSISGFGHEDRGNQNVEWYTPPEIFEGLGVQFDLDPCHPEEPLAWVPARTTFNIKDDGLSRQWFGKVWMNPPYGKHTPLWMEKMHNHRNGIALVFARTDCKWFHDYVAKADAILFLKGRVRFVDGFGVSGGSGAGSGSMLVAWGDECVQALERMKDRGHLVTNQTTDKGAAQ